MRYLLALIALLICFNIASAERFVYWLSPNLPIPPDTTVGVRDTMFIPDSILIEDLNVYIGIDAQGWGDLLVIPIKSPWHHQVFLANRNLDRPYFNIWFDTQTEEDGPGQLEDYNGHYSNGNWIINPSQPMGHFDFIFSTWAIEIYGQLMTDVKDEINQPLKFGISSGYPNPFNDKTQIKFSLKDPGQTTLKIYNIIGQEVCTLLDGQLQPGTHFIDWDASGLASGVYLFVLKSSDQDSHLRLTLLK